MTPALDDAQLPSVRATICELPHRSEDLDAAWAALRAHLAAEHSDLLVLPELAFAPPVWKEPQFAPALWREALASSTGWLDRLSELGVALVLGTRPVSEGDAHFNEGFRWSSGGGLEALRRKHFMPDEPGGWERQWFAPGPPNFPPAAAGLLTFGLNICTELWALDSFRAYAAGAISAVVVPRATAAATTEKWLAAGTVAAVASGAYCLSSNRVEADGSCGGVGWAIDPDGAVLALTSAAAPFRTIELDPQRALTARGTYPRYVFAPPRTG